MESWTYSQIKTLNIQILKLNEHIEQIQTESERKVQQAQNQCKQKIIQIQQLQSNLIRQIDILKQKNNSLQADLTNALNIAKQLKQQKVLNERILRQQFENTQKQWRRQLENKKSQWVVTQKNLMNKYSLLQNDLQSIKQAQMQQKNIGNKTVQKLQGKLKNYEIQIQQLLKQKNNCQLYEEAFQKQLRQKQKQIKVLKKTNAEMVEKVNELIQQSHQWKIQFQAADTKRKILTKKQIQLRKQLQKISEECTSQIQVANRQKQHIKDLKQEIHKINQCLQVRQLKIKELESNLYKANINLEDQKKNGLELAVKVDYLQSLNVKLSEKLALSESQRQSVIKTIVNEKQLIERQNIKLLQMLELKQNTIRAIMQSANDIQESKLSELSQQIKNKQVWNNVSKENLKDSEVRRNAIQKWLLN